MKRKNKTMCLLPGYMKFLFSLCLVMGVSWVFAEQKSTQSKTEKSAAVKTNPLMSTDDNKEFRNQELVRLKEKEAEIDAKVRQAIQYRQNKEYDKAIDLYLEAKSELEEMEKNQPVERFKKKISACSLAISKIYYEWAQSLYMSAQKDAKANSYTEAIEKCKKAIEIYPQCKDEMEKVIHKYELLRDGADENEKLKDLYPSAKDKKEIQILLRQGLQLYKTGQWDKARTKYQEVIIIDPYNENAIEQIHKINMNELKAAKLRTGVTRSARAAAAQWQEVMPLIRMDTDEKDTAKTIIAKDSPETKILNKLKELIIDDIRFDEVSIQTAFHYLRTKSKEIDPEKIGVNFVLRGTINRPFYEDEDEEAEETDTKQKKNTAGKNSNNNNEKQQEEDIESVDQITMVLSKVPLERVLTYICDRANLRYKIDENAVIVASKDVQLEDLQVKVYPVEPTVFNQDDMDVQQILEQRGMKFDGDASAKYKKNLSRLVLINTPDQLRFFENKILQDLVKEDPQILIQTKFVEIELNDLQELGFKYSLSRANNNVEKISTTDSRVQTATLADGQSIDFKTTDFQNIYTSPQTNVSKDAWATYASTANQLVYKNGQYTTQYTNNSGAEQTIYYTKAPIQSSSSTYTLGGTQTIRTFNIDGSPSASPSYNYGKAFDLTTWNNNGYKFNVQIFAMDQASSTDILSCPRVTTMNEQKASIELVSEEYFPDDWDEAQYSYMGNNVPVFIGSVPDLGDAVPLGIILNVTPFVDPTQNDTILLQMSPLIRQFGGWDDYSYKVQMTLDQNKGAEDVENTMRMPKFKERTLDTQVYCEDNGTIVLGGMVDDETKVIDDKYPILGDLPLVGRLFQSKGRSARKYSLLIFLSCRLVKPDGSPLREREERGLPSFKY